jgi:hypothetical protein
VQNGYKIKILVRRVAKGKLKKARFYKAFRVSQTPKNSCKREGTLCHPEL